MLKGENTSEGDHLLSSHEQSQLVLALDVKLRQLKTSDLGSNGGGDTFHCHTGLDNARERVICILAVLVVLKFVKRAISA